MKARERERANEANMERAFENPCRGSETRFHSFWSTPSRASWPRAASARIPGLGVRVQALGFRLSGLDARVMAPRCISKLYCKLTQTSLGERTNFTTKFTTYVCGRASKLSTNFSTYLFGRANNFLQTLLVRLWDLGLKKLTHFTRYLFGRPNNPFREAFL